MTLTMDSTPTDPFMLFKAWMDAAVKSKVLDPTAMMLSTCGNDRRPSARIVLLKGTDDKGFVFYTNYSSKKGKELEENPLASLTFYWPDLQRQIRIEGEVFRVSEAESEDYFITRPRESQIGALASPQSKPVPNRAYLDESFKAIVAEMEGKQVPRPAHWGGYRLVPDYFEFWQGRASRLHDRIVYNGGGGAAWTKLRLAP